MCWPYDLLNIIPVLFTVCFSLIIFVVINIINYSIIATYFSIVLEKKFSLFLWEYAYLLFGLFQYIMWHAVCNIIILADYFQNIKNFIIYQSLLGCVDG